MTDCATLGSYREAAKWAPENPVSGTLWRNIAAKKEGLGNPEPFFGKPEESNWQSFTVTCQGNKFLIEIERFSRNKPGSGALMIFKDSNWLMSIVVAHQPHFKNQPEDMKKSHLLPPQERQSLALMVRLLSFIQPISLYLA